MRSMAISSFIPEGPTFFWVAVGGLLFFPRCLRCLSPHFILGPLSFGFEMPHFSFHSIASIVSLDELLDPLLPYHAGFLRLPSNRVLGDVPKGL